MKLKSNVMIGELFGWCGLLFSADYKRFWTFKMAGFYDELCNMLIRPARQNYSDYDLGPPALGSLALRQNFTFLSNQKHTIRASFYRQRNPVTSVCVLYLHSFNGSRLQPLRFVPEVVRKGFHFCSMDFAGCGNSGGDYVTLGYYQRWDALQRWGVREVIVWGRSMGAATAIKLYSLLQHQQGKGRLSELRILGMVLDSAFISLKRMVVEVGCSRMNIPTLFVKALFMMVGTSIQQRANFRLEELELAEEVGCVRCPVMLLASKEDTFVSYNHSEEIYARLPLHDHKQIEYTHGQHYQQRSDRTIQTVLAFIEQKYRLFAQITPRQLRLSYCIRRDASLEKPGRSLRQYEPRRETEVAQQEGIQRPRSGDRGPAVGVGISLPGQFASVGSEKRLCDDRRGERQYQTQKKLMGPPVKITFGRRAVQAKEGLRSKSKPTFSGKILEVVSRTHEENPRAGSSEQTEDCEAENHCNVITDKLKKRGRAHKEQPQFESHQQPHVNAIRFDTVKGTNEEPREKPQKLSMTAQQYKNTQIKLLRGVVQLSPSVKRKGKVRGWEQSKSMSNLYSGLTPTAGQVRSSSKLNLVGPQNTTTPRKE